jgi:hypothetical protein
VESPNAHHRCAGPPLAEGYADSSDAKDALFQLGATYAEIANWPASTQTFAQVLDRKDLTADDRPLTVRTDVVQRAPLQPPPIQPADPTALPPLQQSNELANGSAPGAASPSTTAQKDEELVDISSSKKPKKKGLGKLNPF